MDSAMHAADRHNTMTRHMAVYCHKAAARPSRQFAIDTVKGMSRYIVSFMAHGTDIGPKTQECGAGPGAAEHSISGHANSERWIEMRARPGVEFRNRRGN
jgi:hypothetical protein